MKQYKIYAKGNYIVVVDVLKNEYFYGTKKEVFVDKSNVNKNTYKIFNIKHFNNETVLQIPNILKEDGSAYSELEFDTFYQENTGNFNGGGTAPTSGLEYSFDERKVGTFQINNSEILDIYQKTVILPEIPQNSTGNVNTGIFGQLIVDAETTDFSQVVEVGAYGFDSTNNLGTIPRLVVSNQGGEFILNYWEYPYASNNVYLTIRYVKEY